jgi:large conductance mechanosensitive channel
MQDKKFIAEQLKRAKDEISDEIEGIVGEKRLQEFKKFAFKGQMIQMAIAFMLGAAFNAVVKSISENLIMPMVNYGLSHTGSNWREYTWEPVTGLAIEAGQFAGAFVDFLLIAVIFFVVWHQFLRKIFKEEEKKKEPEIECIQTIMCKHCRSVIHWECKRCPHGTSWIADSVTLRGGREI